MASTEQQRLIDILTYIEEVEKINQDVFFQVAQHKIFSAFQNEIRGLPGIYFDLSTEDGDRAKKSA